MFIKVNIIKNRALDKLIQQHEEYVSQCTDNGKTYERVKLM